VTFAELWSGRDYRDASVLGCRMASWKAVQWIGEFATDLIAGVVCRGSLLDGSSGTASSVVGRVLHPLVMATVETRPCHTHFCGYSFTSVNLTSRLSLFIRLAPFAFRISDCRRPPRPPTNGMAVLAAFKAVL